LLRRGEREQVAVGVPHHGGAVADLGGGDHVGARSHHDERGGKLPDVNFAQGGFGFNG